MRSGGIERDVHGRGPPDLYHDVRDCKGSETGGGDFDDVVARLKAHDSKTAFIVGRRCGFAFRVDIAGHDVHVFGRLLARVSQSTGDCAGHDGLGRRGRADASHEKPDDDYRRGWVTRTSWSRHPVHFGGAATATRVPVLFC